MKASLLALLPLALVARPIQSPRDAVDFNRDVRPILSDRCFPCHGPDAHARKADLRLDTFGGATADRGGYAAIVPGKPDESEMLRRIEHEDPGERMPPPRSKLTVTVAERALLARWIAGGGRYTKHWAFVPPRRSAPPRVQRAEWPRDRLDRFVLARLEAEGLDPAPETERATWLRRASFVLTGLPPSPAEIDAFVADREPDAYGRQVDRLLASPRYGERLAQDWLDVARYADTYGYQADVDRRVWPYRDWVIRAFNDNLPYDDFVTWQLAGDLLPEATREQRLATTFNRLHRQTNEGGSVEEEYRVEYVADRTHTFGTAFLGLTLECAQCHDHKFDPVPQVDFYRLAAFFDNVDESGLYSHFTRAVPTPTLLLPSRSQEKKLAELAASVRPAQKRLEDLSRSRRDAFEQWLSDGRAGEPRIPGCIGDFPLDDLAKRSSPNRADRQKPARTHDDPKSVPGVIGRGVLLSGENNVSFPGIASFRRTQPFTIALWLRTPDVKERAVVFHRSRAWTDAGSQGYQLLIEDGRLSASLIHFWPGNAIRVRAKEPLATGTWTHVAVTYDGSVRARGLRIRVDGRAVPVTVVRDRLYKGITGGGGHLTIGQRFRDKGFKGGAVDEFRVFSRCLTPLEVAELHVPGTLAAAMGPEKVSDTLSRLFEYYLANHDAEVRAAQSELQRLRAEHAKTLDRVPEIMAMAEMPEPRPTHVLARGSYLAKGAVVTPGTPDAILPFDETLPENRLGLARWLTRPEHPLTARVAVNRLWYLVFGRGLVVTLENFGSQGAPPTHGVLLDDLALDFVASGWDVKAMLKRFVLSATFRQASRGTAPSREHDPDNVLLSRGPARRASAEMMRDHALLASGLLVEKLGGPSVKPYQPPGLWKEKSGKVYRRDKGEGLYRRSLYTFWKRTSPPPSMMILDAAKRDVCVARRQTTSTPLQALLLLNDPQFVEGARVLASRTLREGGATRDAKIAFAFRWLTSRLPAGGEARLLAGLLDRQLDRFRADAAAAAALLAVGDAPLPKGADRAALAAWTVLCSTILSYDAAVMIR